MPFGIGSRELLLILGACVGSVLASRGIAPVPLEDRAIVRELLADEALDSSEYEQNSWSAILSTDSVPVLIILRNGTEYHRADARKSAAFLKDHPGFFRDFVSRKSVTWLPALSRAEPDWEWLKTSPGDLRGPIYGWSDGLALTRGLISARGERWWIRDYWDISLSRIWRDFRAEAGWSVYSDYMSLQRVLRNYYGAHRFSDWSWKLKGSWRWVTIGAEKAGWVLPEYYWMEPQLDSLLSRVVFEPDSAVGRVIRLFQGGVDRDHGANLGYSLDLRFWYFRYTYYRDRDMYTFPLHRLAVEDVPTGWGKAGFFAVRCGKISVPGFWLEIGPAGQKRLPDVLPWTDLRWYPMRVSFEYLNTVHFRFAALTRIGVF